MIFILTLKIGPKYGVWLKPNVRCTKRGKTVVTIDLGDFSDRCHPLTEATDGRANVAIMNTLAYDLVTIGNNEGIGNSKKQLEHLYDQATFEVVLANLEEPKPKRYQIFVKHIKL